MIYRFFITLTLLCTWPCFSSYTQELDLPEGYELDLNPFSEEESDLSDVCEKDLKDDPVPTPAYLETLPSSVVAGCVNVITGDFFESQVDLVVPGPKSLVVQKSWNSRDKKWHFSHLPKLFTSLSQSRENREACYLDDTGSGMLFRGSKNIGDSQTLSRGLKVPRKVLQKSMHNCGFGEISGQTNWKNAAIYYVKNTKHKKLLLRHGTHTDRIFSFKRLKNNGKSKQYRLKEERHPGSVSFYYSYGRFGHLNEIKGINGANEVVQCLDISKEQGTNTYTWDSASGNVSYHYDKKDKLLETRSSQNISPSYSYDDQNRIVKKV